MAVVEEGVCQIHRINAKGAGISSSENGPIELPYTLTGELVKFQRHKYRRGSNCVLTEIIEPSTARQQPKCEYFGKCGGCLLQHFHEQDYTALKQNMVVSALGALDISTNILPIITVPAGNRRRANLEAVKRDDRILMGFHKFHSNQIIDINTCPALMPELSALLMPLKKLLQQILGNKQKAQIFLTIANNGIDITLELYKQPRLTEEQRDNLRIFAEANKLIRIVFRAKKFTDIVYQTEEPYVLFDNVRVNIDAYCFLQASFASDNILKDLVLRYAAGSINGVDLFCGRGTYTLPLSGVLSVDGFESDAKAIVALEKAINPLDRQISIMKRDLFDKPISAAELNKYDFAVINPPRAGAAKQSVELSMSNVAKIVYVSCNPETFALDAKALIQGGYVLHEVTPLDQFYWSPHVEVIGFFQKS